MSSSYTPSLTLTQIGNGEQSGTWGTTTNTNWQLIEDAVAGVAQVSVSGTSDKSNILGNVVGAYESNIRIFSAIKSVFAQTAL